MNILYKYIYALHTRKLNKGFTLVEILIVLVLIGILSTLVTRTYIQITDIAIKITHERVLQTNNSLLDTYMQSIADTHYISYDTYVFSGNEQSIVSTSLDLSGIYDISVYMTGDCLPFTGNMESFAVSVYGRSCRIEASIDQNLVQLTDPMLVYPSNVLFTISTGSLGTDQVQGGQYGGFWFHGFLFIKNPQSDRKYNAFVRLQNFYNTVGIRE